MKKAKNRLIAILLLFLLSSSSFILYNNVENGASNSLIQDINSPRLSNPGKSLLHSYDFEDETIGQDPTYESLTIDESSGDVYIDDLSDGQQKHLALHKVGTSGRVWVRDNFSRFGEAYTAGEYHLKVYHDASGFGINLNSANGEYILAMVWEDGDIRDDVDGTFLATYAYDQWLDVVIYFNLSLGWMFDLEGVRYGAGYTFSFFEPFTANAEHIWITSFISGGGDGYFRVDDISFYYETENLINIFTPESKEYRKPMDGYYPATYGFENDANGISPEGWINQDWSGCTSEIISELDGHSKVLRQTDNSNGFGAVLNYTFTSALDHGTVEFFARVSVITPGVRLWFDLNSDLGQEIWFVMGDSGIQYWAGGPWYDIIPSGLSANTWYHFSVRWRNTGAPVYEALGEGEWKIFIDGVEYGNYDLVYDDIMTSVNLESGAAPFGHITYWDAIGFDWDPNYNIGDNLYEGLLLSFTNSTALDWIGYSLDGQTNKTILGNSTIPMPEEGIHSIQVFGNDSLGDMYQSDLRHFTVDFPIDIITPEAKTYEKGMSGYYPATFGFEETKTDTLPSYCNYAPGGSSPDGPGSYAKVIDNWTDGAGNTHKKVLKTYDRTSSGTAHGWLNFTEEGSEICRNSTIEFWACNTLTGVYYHSYFEIWGDLGNMVSFEWDSYGTTNDPEVRITPATGEFGTGVYHEWNRWYRYSIDISCDGGYAGLGANEFRFQIYDETGTLIYTSANLDLLTAHPTGGPYRYHVLSTQSQSDVSHYLDGFGITGLQDNYVIGENLNEGLLLSYENNTTLDWTGYSLDYSPIKTVLGNTTIPIPRDGLHSIQIFGNDSLGTNYQSNVRYFSVSRIKIITPEEKTYEKGMSGYYPSTYGFENVKDGALPTDWMFNWDGTSYVEVDDTKDGHNKVLEVRKIDDGAQYSGGTKIFENNATAGTVEFWLYKDTNGATDATKIDVKGDAGNVRLLIENQDLFRGDYGSRVLLASDVFMINTWYHIRIDFNVSQGGWQVQLDNTWYGSGYTIPFTGTPTEFWGFGIGSHWSGCNNNYGAWLDALSYSWDPNYNIGDNLNEGLLLSYENSTNLDWQGYSLDGQPINTIMGNTTIPMPEEGIHSIQVFANASLGLNYYSDIRYFTIRSPISIITPENKTYTEPMSGYYPGTFGFENDEDGSKPYNWTVSEPGGIIQIIGEKDGHNKVAEIHETSSTLNELENRFSAPQANGSVEYYFMVNRIDDTHDVAIIGNGSSYEATIHILVGDNGYLKYKNDLGSFINIVSVDPNRWYHMRIEFNCSDDWHLWLDGISQDGGSGYTFFGTPSSFDRLKVRSSTAGIWKDAYIWIDAIGYSWDPYYIIGANIEEGLLLSYENSTALDWQGYSLDGQTNKTILGNTTIQMPENSLHIIQIFGRDSLGTIYRSNIRYFTVNTTQIADLIAPVIVINLPGQNTLFGSGAPSYDITVIELNLNTMWYTLDWGLINTTITEPTGTIDQTLWNNRPNGTVDIRFYADDIAGNVGFEEVTVRKDILPPQITITNPIQNQLFDETAPSFDLTISEGNLDARWYSLDGGATAIQFIGFAGTINQTEWDKIADGTATIMFYANDTLNNLGFSEVSVRKDTVEPQITINAPSQDQVFYDMAPSFDLTIIDGNLDAIWYTLDDGIVTFLCGTSGNINNLYWNAIPPGFYILKFYANDTLGNIGFSEVTIKKEEPAIPGYNTSVLSLILLIGIMGVSLKIKKKLK